MPEIVCPLCLGSIDEHLIVLHCEGEALVIERIKAEHPEWVELDGSCPKCVEYYRESVSGVKSEPESLRYPSKGA